MFAQFNPCQPCCCYNLDRVLVYARYEQTSGLQDYLELVNYYRTILGGPSFVNYVTPNMGAATPLTWKELQQYNLIIIPMPYNLEAFLDVPLMKAWLACGQRRLLMTGEYGPNWDLCNAFVNDYMTRLQTSLRMTLGKTVAVTTNCSNPIDTSEGYTDLVGYMVNAASPWVYGNASGIVTGGTELGRYSIDMPEDLPYYVTMAYQRFPTGTASEVILIGDTQYLGGQCVDLAKVSFNQRFYRALHPKFNPVP